MNQDSFGRIVLDDTEIMELLYTGFNIDNVNVMPSKEIELYNKYTEIINNSAFSLKEPVNVESIKDFDKINQQAWFMPEEYKELDIRELLLAKTNSDPERKRVINELNVYEVRGLLNLLRFLVYLIDTMRENKIVWGVGRGSSVASYVLYLIGVHRVDSLKYNLEFDEFLN